ncbi:MAG: DegV family protein [Acidimicrobiales bacterium]|jgi:DegV family protein with EDD domain
MPEEIPADGLPRVLGEGGVQSTSGKPGIRVVTDSAADLDKAVAADHGVGVVHLDVRLGAFGPEATSSWSPEEFWERSAAVAELPETSAPSPGQFKETFSAMAEEGAEGIVCITLSSKLSATYQAAVIGAESVSDRIPVRVVDSLLATMAEGLTVLDAVAAAEAGGDLAAVERVAVASRERILLFGALESLDNLRKGGRLGSAQALLGGLLDIKPVLEIRDGALVLESRPRTRSRSFERLTTKVREAGELDRIAVVHAAASDVDSFVELLATLLPKERINVGWLGPVIGAHVGRGTVAVAAQRRVT